MNLTLIEENYDGDSPMIGTLLNVSTTNLDEFKRRVKSALNEHFDSSQIRLTNIKSVYENFLDEGCQIQELSVVIDSDYKSTIKFMRTWVY